VALDTVVPFDPDPLAELPSAPPLETSLCPGQAIPDTTSRDQTTDYDPSLALTDLFSMDEDGGSREPSGDDASLPDVTAEGDPATMVSDPSPGGLPAVENDTAVINTSDNALRSTAPTISDDQDGPLSDYELNDSRLCKPVYDYFSDATDPPGDLASFDALMAQSIAISEENSDGLSPRAPSVTPDDIVRDSSDTVDGELRIDPGQQLVGSGTLTGDVFLQGTFSPGNSPGIITIDGDLIFDSEDEDTINDSYTPPVGPDAEDTVSTLIIEIGGSTPGPGAPTDNGYDQVNVTGEVILGGDLEIVLINSYEPVLGTTFDFLIFDTVSGSFDTVTGPWGFGGSDVYFEINELSDRLQLEVAAIPSGEDFHTATSVTDNAEEALQAMADQVDQALSDLFLANSYLTDQLIPGTGMSLDELFDISDYFGIGSIIEDYLEPMQPLDSDLRFEIGEFLSFLRVNWLDKLGGGSAVGEAWVSQALGAGYDPAWGSS